MNNHKISTKKIREFIQGRLVKQIAHDLRNSTIASEGDLQSSVYYHLRNYLEKYDSYKIQNKISLSEKGKPKLFPDLAISKYVSRPIPKIAIELKEHRKFSEHDTKKDLKKLQDFVSKDYFDYGFFIHVCWDPLPEKKLQIIANNLISKSYRSFVIPIIINALDRATAREFVQLSTKRDRLSAYRTEIILQEKRKFSEAARKANITRKKKKLKKPTKG